MLRMNYRPEVKRVVSFHILVPFSSTHLLFPEQRGGDDLLVVVGTVKMTVTFP